MRKGKNYLLTLDNAPTITPKDGDQATIFDWSAGNSFQVVTVVSSQSPWAKSVHVLAILDNAYNSSNFQNSRLRYRDTMGNQESQEIVKVTELD